MTKQFKQWLRAAGIRAVKTVAQTFAAVIGTGALMSEVNWGAAASAAALAGILSIATSVAGLPEVGADKTKEGGCDNGE